MTELEFSIVLCTRNRARLLEGALQGLLAIEYAPDRVELIVVDNGSTDGTKEVAARHAAGSRFAFRYVHEPRPGLSVARNRGIREAQGAYLLFTDDDQRVDPGILREFARVVAAGAGAVQGAIELEFSVAPPHWLHGELAAFLGATRKLEEGSPAGYLHGGNMLLRRNLFEHVGGFREDLGKGAGGYDEDTELSERLRAAGIAVFAAPRARQWHLIGPERTTPRFLRRMAFEKGLSQGSLGEARRALTSSLRNGLRAARARLSSDEHTQMLSEVCALYELGRFVGYARLSKRRLTRRAP